MPGFPKICRLDNELRRCFLKELTSIREETQTSISEKALMRINEGESYKGINVWQRAFTRYSGFLEEEHDQLEQINHELVSGRAVRFGDLIGFFGFLLGFHEYVVHGARSGNLFEKGNSGFSSGTR